MLPVGFHFVPGYGFSGPGELVCWEYLHRYLRYLQLVLFILVLTILIFVFDNIGYYSGLIRPIKVCIEYVNKPRVAL